MRNAVKFRFTDVARQNEELARFKVVQGPDYGSIFVITASKVTMGRGDECDIVISDLKASRIHAQLSQDPQGWMVKDFGSANGLVHNGKEVREAKLALHDTLTFGETTLEFVTADAQTQFIIAPPRSMDQVQKDWQATTESKPTVTAQNGSNRTRFLIYGVVVLGLWLLLDSGSSPQKADINTRVKDEGGEEASTKDLASYLTKLPKNKTVETLFKDGMREYFDGNFHRARTQFETVLQIMPGHRLAVLYLENCNHEVDEEVKMNLEGGRADMLAGRLRESRSRYKRVMQILYMDQSNPAFIEAKDQHDKVQQKIHEEDAD